MLSYAPKTLDELYKSLDSLTPKSKIISGGTDLIIRLNTKSCTPDALLYMGSIKELSNIEIKGNDLIIGACATMTEIENCPIMPKAFSAIVHSASDVGSLQIRNSGTIGGNIANASPAGDLIPVLWLLNAKVEIAGPKGLRYEGINNLILSPGKTTMAYNEAITRFIITIPTDKTIKTAFHKLGSRGKVTISRIGVAAMLSFENDIIKDAKFVVGAISIKPVVLKDAENALIGNKLTQEVKLNAAQILSDYIYKNTPKEFDRDYKASASKGAVCDMLNKF